MTIDFDKVSQRAIHLDRVRATLKTEFFGIAPQIDAIMDSIKTWYLMPELVTRPLIVSLWSLTGCGKTSLVRSLVNHLSFTSQFVEVQMDGFSNGATGDEKSISSILLKSSIQEGGQGILLLDEFQRFRTIDNQGNDLKVERFADVWMLLSDGKFPANYAALERMERSMTFWDYWDDKHAADRAEEEVEEDDDEESKADKKSKARREPKYKRKYLTEMEDADTLKNTLRINLPLKEIMTWPPEKTRAVLREAIEKKDIPPLDFTKCLVFISGNLDEAFKMSGEVDDCDTNADIYHEYTKRIGSVEIKAALTRRFKPEQISRLGNNHVIYPSLNKDAYLDHPSVMS